MSRKAGAILCALAVLALCGCSGDGGSERFCELLTEAEAAGPLFPDRTDGEPVPDMSALSALEALAAEAPEDLRPHLEVLLAEADHLVNAAEARSRGVPEPDGSDQGRPSLSVVQEAQAAMIVAASDRCSIELLD